MTAIFVINQSLGRGEDQIVNPVRQYRHLSVATSANPPFNDFDGFRKDDIQPSFRERAYASFAA
jgi:hypothetical protein